MELPALGFGTLRRFMRAELGLYTLMLSPYRA